MKLELNSPTVYSDAVEEDTQAGPVQNTWYTIFDSSTAKNVKIKACAICVEDTDETLEARVTIDGTTLTVWGGLAMTHSGTYYVVIGIDATVPAIYSRIIASDNIANRLPFEGKDVKIEIRKTTNAGAGRFEWAIWYSKAVKA